MVNTPSPTLGARLGGGLFFLIFFAFGVVFLYFIARELYRVSAVRSWPATSCVIESSGVDTGKHDYRFHVRYRYVSGGQTRHSKKYSTNSTTTGDFATMQKLAASYLPDSTARCFVDPKNPDNAVLFAGDYWIAPFALIPLLFVFIGGVGIVSLIRGSDSNIASSGSSVQRPISRRIAAAAIVFCCVLFYFITVRTLIRIVEARGWIATPCVIESSRVQSHQDSDSGTTYSVDILYAYTFNGHMYRSNQNKLMGGSSSGYSGKQAVVHSLPVGAHSVCFVDPSDPNNAVLDRGVPGEIFFGLIPLTLIVVFSLVFVKQPRAA